MDVTQSNFEDFYKEIQEYIPKADFYSIDFEMTGIKTSDYEMITDMPYEKYLKLRSAANKYRIIQVGLCLFFKTGEKEIQARPYNIYIFPREHFRVSPQINVDVSAAEFNTNHNMDWNKWFYEGVTYMSLKQAKKRRADLEKEDKKPKTDLNNLVKLVREDDIQKSEKFVQDLKNWIAENKKEPFIFEEANSFFRKHIYDTLTKDFPNLFYETIIKEESTSKEIHIYNFADETEKKLHEEKKKKEKDDIMWKYVGFTNVVKLLIDSKKPLAGHNCYFDLLFLYSHFIDTLPYSYDDFKKDLHRLFPEIYDTKFIVQYTKFKSKIGQKSHLGLLAESFINSEDPDFHHFKLILEDKFKAYEPGNLENPRYHEAGYDAFLTGVIYAKMFFMLDKEEQERVKNSINTMRCLYSVKLSSEDPFIKEATIYVIKSKDKEEKIASEDILPHFEEHKLEDPVRIFTLNGSGFPGSMIIFESQNEEQKKLFVSGIEGLIQKGESILSYEEYCQVRREAYDKGNNKNS